MPTSLIRGLYNVTAAHQGGILTLGHFDGVHIGHQALIKETVARAKKYGVPAIAVTFEPHAFEYFMQENISIPRLTRFREKFCALAALGIDYVLVITFNQELASISASDFIKKKIYPLLRPQQILVGDDFRFGKGREGDGVLLSQLGEQCGFEVFMAPTVSLKEERVSSTRIRKALLEAELSLAAELLGRPYSMMGRVSGGDRLGRQLGFPTANIFLHRRLTPLKGIYTVKVYGISALPLVGAANVGNRPTVDGSKTLLEVHLLDFNQDIYGRYVEVVFCKKLRDEVHYPTLDLLQEQIAKDVAMTRAFFKLT